MHELPPELRNVVDEYDHANNAEVLESYDELFEVLRQLHDLHPDWRFGQLIVALAGWSGTTRPGNAYSVPDERLLKVARKHLRERAGGKRRSKPGERLNGVAAVIR